MSGRRAGHARRRLIRAGTAMLAALAVLYFLPDAIVALHLYPEPKPRYDYHLVFPRDGVFHGNDDAPTEVMYVVERRDKAVPATVDLTYFSKNNTVIIDETNLVNLSVSAKAVYHDEAWKMLLFDWRDDATLYKSYFVDKQVLHVDLRIDGPMTALTFIDVPKPTRVLLNGADYTSKTVWSGGGAAGSITAPVPDSKVRHQAEIWFVEYRAVAPTAIAAADKAVVKKGEPIQFDGSRSHDNDGNGTLKQFYWDFGDGEYAVGPKPAHAYNISYPVAMRVDLVVEDWQGLIDRDSLFIDVNRGDSWPPTADAGPDVTGFEDELIELNGSRSTDNVGVASHEWTTGDGGTATGPVATHAYARSGTYTATLVVRDAAGNSGVDSADVKVVNLPPSASAGPDVTGAVNQSLIFDGSRSADTPSDLKNLVHVWDFGDGTGGDGAVRKHAFAKAGDYTVTLTVIDDDGARSSDTLVARVEDRPNLPPAIRPIRDVFVRLGEPWPLNLEPYISDDNLSSLLLATDSPYAQPFPTNETRLALRLHYTDPLVRTETVKVSVDDGQYNASGTLNVTVVENDWPPEPVGEIPAQVMKEDEEKRAAFSAKDFFTDRDANDTLEYTAVAPPEVSVTVESDLTVTIKGAKDWFGTVTASIRAVDDASAWYEQPFKIVVEAVNDAPFVVFQPTNVNVRLGEEWRFGLADVFDDVDDITLTYTSSDPAVKVDPATGAATWRPSTAEESVEVAFTAKDREGLAVSTSKIKLVAVRAGLDPATVSLGALLAILLTLIFTFLYLRHVWKFQVHEVFVVTEAGLLASHVSSSRSRVVHQELVAAMLTAIRKFVQESFGEEKQAERGLGRLDYEGFVISVEQGKGFFVAIVLSGADSPPLRKKMRSAVAALEARWGEVLKDWDGDEERVEGMDELVRREFELAKQDSSVINLQERADENSGEEGESREGSPGEDRDDERDGDPGGDRGSDSGGEGDEEPSEESEGAKEEQNESPKEESSA